MSSPSGIGELARLLEISDEGFEGEVPGVVIWHSQQRGWVYRDIVGTAAEIGRTSEAADRQRLTGEGQNSGGAERDDQARMDNL